MGRNNSLKSWMMLVLLALAVCVLSTLLGSALCAGSAPLWRYSPKSSFVVSAQVIGDVSGDEHEDVFLVTSSSTSYSGGTTRENPAEIILLDGKSGLVFRSLSLGMVSPAGGLYVNDRVIVSFSGGLLSTYNSSLQLVWSKTYSEVPKGLQSINNEHIIFFVGRNATSTSLVDGRNLWIWVAPVKITGMLVMPDYIVCTYPDYVVMLDVDGHFLSSKYVPRPNIDDAIYTETLCRLDETYFLYTVNAYSFFGSSSSNIFMIDTQGGSPNQMWTTQIGSGAANRPFVIPDIDRDTISDLVCRSKDKDELVAYSGLTGWVIRPIAMDALYVRSGCWIDDVDKDGVDDVALAPYKSNYSHGLYIGCFDRDGTVWRMLVFDCIFDHLCSIQDVDGDMLADVVGVTSAGKVECYQTCDSVPIPELGDSYVLTVLLVALTVAILLKKGNTRVGICQ